jgi:hypothetical protein
MKNIIVTLICFLIISSCQEDGLPSARYKYDEGIYFELIEDGDQKEKKNPYNKDNEIYLGGKEFVYKYKYQDSVGNYYQFKREGYELTPLDSITQSTLVEVSIIIEEDRNFFDSDYEQTVAEYRYYLPNGEAIYPRNYSGIVENEKNIWMHPFRSPCYFRLLQLCPFPFIQLPEEIGKKWNWSLDTGNLYDCDQWGEWEGVVESKYEYEIISKEQLLTQMGDLECYVVKSIGKGTLGETELISYFNKENGFVRLEYKNVNKSKMTLELIEVKGK